MNLNERIDYLEFPVRDIPASKAFFQQVFGWTFEDFGPDYTTFKDATLQGGFCRADKAAAVTNGSVLVVLYSPDLEAAQGRIEQAGGSIAKPIFEFPGGRRFHFTEPSGNELAVWSDR